jgi:long-chain acyl-CoA synthetase
VTTLDPRAAFEGRRVFLLGGTGFLGKVCLSMLLDRFPGIGRVYLMVRASTEAESESRFWESVVPSPALDPLRARYRDGLEDLLREKIVVVGGDITHENLGLSEEAAARVAADIDVLVNSSGRVTFNPPLEAALKTNVTGTLNTLAFAKRMRRPALVHVSTCFVAGNRSGEIWENEPLLGYFPRKGVETSEFSVEKEIDDCERLAARVRDESQDKSLADRFRELARKRFFEEGRDPDDEKAMGLAIARERKNWIRSRLTELGIRKAQDWGWPNIYTYTKSLGEQLVAAEKDVVRAIVRPAIVESAVEFPFPGWNEGFTTTAPLVRMAMRGQNLFPVKTNVILDVIPVDMVASAVLAVTAETLVREPELVFQVSSGDSNPSRLGRLVDLLGLFKRKHFRGKSSGNRLVNEIAARMEAQAVKPEAFEKYSLPLLHKVTKKLSETLDKVTARKVGPLAPFVSQTKEAIDRFEAFTREGEEHYNTFRPFIVDNNYVFRADNTRALFARLALEPALAPAGVGSEGQKLLYFEPEAIDWYHYWLEVHLPGLQKWVFPKLDEAEKTKSRRIYTYRNLIELFDACTKNHRGRTAMRIEREGREERYTYGDFRECTLRAAAFLKGLKEKPVKPGERVGLLAENSPEWGMAYFGIIRTGATVIPLEKESSTEDVVRLLRLGQARALLLSPALAEKHRDLPGKLAESGLDVDVFSFDDVFRLMPEASEQKRIASLPETVSPQTTASIIFTSGTTGNPKGVMLTHKNFVSLLAKLLSVYDITEEDGMLSVLPLHHSFEFTTGFLLPLSRGAQIVYLAEVNGENVSRALRRGQITCIVGVPAFWDLLKRRILGRFQERSTRLEEVVEALVDANYLLRDEAPFNFGPILFLPIHLAFGGRIRYLISGGSALSESTLKTFRGLGFNLNEGYGLTEASPVLTVTRPEGKVVSGSVGQPLPGIEIRIHEPDRKGVGEVIARGPSIMAGYFENDKATDEALRDGWLHTGDLGRLDEEGNLYIVGRSKEIIVDSNGKNVYPDEIEELYAAPGLVKELAVVGLPDGAGERVAAVFVPAEEAPSPDVSVKIEEHVHQVSSRLPLYKRIKAYEIRSEALPRTATRKVKRKEVVSWLQEKRLLESREAGPPPDPDNADKEWLLDVVARVAEKPRNAVRLDTSLDELGFDSLMYNELSVAIEAKTGESLSSEALMSTTEIRELGETLRRRPPKERDRDRVRVRQGSQSQSESESETETAKIELPTLLQQAGRAGLSVAQRWFYNDVLRPEYKGRSNIPSHVHFLVVANHASHLDMGLVKMALGEAGKKLVALAAADYFFDNKVKRTFFENFTNLVPMERKGSLRKSLEWAFHLLEQGYNVLIFPEGTRSRHGGIQPFQRGLGHLVLRARVGVLPLYLSTHDALPPGEWYPQSRDVSAVIGPFLPSEMLARAAEGLPRSAAERVVTSLVQAVVTSLRDETPLDLESMIAAERARYATDPRETKGVTRTRRKEQAQAGDELIVKKS